jgi:signal transduction histidine kinase
VHSTRLPSMPTISFMDRARLVNVSLGQLNRGLLIFRLGLYAAVVFGLLQRDSGYGTWAAVIIVAFSAFIPAIPGLRWRIEVGVMTTLMLELVLTFVYGPFPALQVMAMFSVAVAGLFLTRRAATIAVVLAMAFQTATLLARATGALPDGANMADLLAETVLLLASGIGFIGIGGVLRRYQTQLMERAREELRLTELVESKERLIDSIAHEIRTPVTAVLGLSSELSSARFLAEHEVAEIAGLVASESRRLAHLVDNLILRSRADIERLAFRSEELTLSSLLRSSWRDMGLDAQDLGIEGDGEVHGDHHRLQHIFVNLFDNSIRHGSPPVTVEISRSVGLVRARVTDSGAGFDQAAYEGAFGDYEARRSPHRPDHVGLGLGVSRMLAQHMGGNLEFNDGATIVILPAVTTAQPARA